MASDVDPWFIRIPDGRILRARSTEALRRYLKTGKIPWDSRVRQAADAPWQPLDAVDAFADLVPTTNGQEEVAATATESGTQPPPRAAALDLRPLGMRGLAEELFNAFDSTLQRAKMTTAAFTGLGIGITLILGEFAQRLLPQEWSWACQLGMGAVLLVLFSVCESILTQLTALELSRFRPAHFSEIRAELPGSIVRLTLGIGLIGSAILGLIILLRSIPAWIAPANPREMSQGLEVLLMTVNGSRLLLEVLCWPILGLALLLLAPILIVEEHSIWRGLYDWLGMLRQHLGRIYLYQAVAFTFAAILTWPLVVPIALAFGNPRDLSLGELVAFYLLVGVSLTPMLAYLLVAHVFVYLNLKYEFFYSARDASRTS